MAKSPAGLWPGVEPNCAAVLQFFLMTWFGKVAPLALLGTLLLSSCSLALDWDLANLPCQGVNQACAGGFSCLAGKCVADGTLAVGASCARDRQCNDGSLCPAGKCAQTCALAEAYTTSTCASAHYCAPFESSAGYTGDPNVAPPPRVVAVCVAGSSCASGTSCDDVPGGICTVITGMGGGLNACVVGCDVTVATDGNSTNNCSKQYYSRYCTPVGNYNYGQLACVTTGATGINSGSDQSACSTVAQPCNPSYGCMGGVCRRYCVPTTGQTLTCQTNEQCCTYNLASNHLGQPTSPIGFCYTANAGCPSIN